MDYKKTTASETTITRNLDEFKEKTGNIYKAIAVMAKRADQISIEIKGELDQKLEEFASYTDNLEEVFENREQIEISKFYERLPKPSLIAAEEMLSDEVYFRDPEETEEKK
jgi:DNA-directed RNA polymerase subunit K/omega